MLSFSYALIVYESKNDCQKEKVLLKYQFFVQFAQNQFYLPREIFLPYCAIYTKMEGYYEGKQDKRSVKYIRLKAL